MADDAKLAADMPQSKSINSKQYTTWTSVEEKAKELIGIFTMQKIMAMP